MPLCGSILPQSPGIYRAVRLNYQHGRSLDLGRECSPLGAMTAILKSALSRAPSQWRASEQILAYATGGSPAGFSCELGTMTSTPKPACG